MACIVMAAIVGGLSACKPVAGTANGETPAETEASRFGSLGLKPGMKRPVGYRTYSKLVVKPKE